MLKLKLYTFFFFCAILCSAQETTKIETEINDLFRKVNKNIRNLDSALVYGKQILNLAETNNLPEYKLRAYMLLGSLNNRGRKFEQSINYYYQAKNFSKKNGNEDLLHKTYQNIANMHLKTAYLDSAIYYFRKSLSYSESKEDSFQISNSKMGMANAYFRKNNLDTAFYYYNGSNLSLNKVIDKRLQSQSYRILGNNYLRMGEISLSQQKFDFAINYADSSLYVAKKYKIEHLFKTSYSLLGRTYSKMGNTSKAEEYFDLEANLKVRRINPNNIMVSEPRNSTVISDRNLSLSKNIKKTVEKKKFYKSGLFVSFLIAILLLSGLLYFKGKKKAIEKEFLAIQEELDLLKNKKAESIQEQKIIKLKSNAVLNVSEILYIKSDGHYVEYYLEKKDRPEIDRNTLIEVTKELPSDTFVRMHRSYIVNIYKIKIINSTKLMLDNGIWLNLSRTYKQELKELLQKQVNY